MAGPIRNSPVFLLASWTSRLDHSTEKKRDRVFFGQFLRHVVGHGLLRPQVETLEKLQAAQRPTTKKQVRSF